MEMEILARLDRIIELLKEDTAAKNNLAEKISDNTISNNLLRQRMLNLVAKGR